MRNGAEFKDDIRKNIEEYAEQRSYFRESSSAVLKDILVRLHRAKDNQSETSEAIAKVIEYIRENYRENLHNSLLAKIAGYLHDIGNLVNRVGHSQSGAVMAFTILHDLGFAPEDIECSECSWTVEDDNAVPRFCPNCGKEFYGDDIR